MKCSVTTRAGHPCPAPATRNSRPPTCTMHGPKALVYQRKGGALSGRAGQLPPEYASPEFRDRESIVAWAQDMAGKVLRGELDVKLSAEARGHAQLALQARTAEAQEKLVEALLRVEHGGAAMMLLTRLQDGLSDGRRRPLTGRPLTASVAEAVVESAAS